jgi:predicted nucleic acid-binding protein
MTQAAEASQLVVDASVAIKWHLVDEEHVEAAATLLRQFMQGEVELVAPAHIRYEVPSAIIVATGGRDPRLTIEQGREAIEEFLTLGLRTIDTDELILSSFPLVHQYTIAFYDALYLALSRELGIPFLTADSRLYQRITSLPNVIWIGDYASGVGS